MLKKSNEQEELKYNCKNSIDDDKKIKRDKLLRTLLSFLGVNLKEDYNKECLKRYILNNDKSKIKLCGFVNDILSNTNIQEFDGESICFILWLEKWVLEEYKKTIINTKIKKTKLDAIKDLALIKKMINHYLNDLNLKFDYENQNENTAKLLNNLQFVIKKQDNIKILDEPIINKYYFGNEKKVKVIDNSEVITYKTDFFKKDIDVNKYVKFVKKDLFKSDIDEDNSEILNKYYIFVNNDVNEYINENMTIIYKDTNKLK